MSSFVKRPKKGDQLFWQLSKAGYIKAKEDLLAAGIVLDKSPKIDWPEGSISASRDHIYAQWQYRYKSDILREKKERIESRLWWKREYRVEHRRVLYVWVFWCPGFFGFAYRGWWTYIVGIGGKYYSSGKKGSVGGRLLDEVIKLFPVTEPTFIPDHDQWQREFVKKNQKGLWCGKPQGKAPIWALIEGDYIIEILSRAKWPDKGR